MKISILKFSVIKMENTKSLVEYFMVMDRNLAIQFGPDARIEEIVVSPKTLNRLEGEVQDLLRYGPDNGLEYLAPKVLVLQTPRGQIKFTSKGRTTYGWA